MGYGTTGRGANGIAGVAAEVQSSVHRRSAKKGIDTHAEIRGRVDLAGHRFAERYRRKHTVQAIDLCACKINPINLAFESMSFSRQLYRHEWTASRRLRA